MALFLLFVTSSWTANAYELIDSIPDTSSDSDYILSDSDSVSPIAFQGRPSNETLQMAADFSQRAPPFNPKDFSSPLWHVAGGHPTFLHLFWLSFPCNGSITKFAQLVVEAIKQGITIRPTEGDSFNLRAGSLATFLFHDLASEWSKLPVDEKVDVFYELLSHQDFNLELHRHLESDDDKLIILERLKMKAVESPTAASANVLRNIFHDSRLCQCVCKSNQTMDLQVVNIAISHLIFSDIEVIGVAEYTIRRQIVKTLLSFCTDIFQLIAVLTT